MHKLAPTRLLKMVAITAAPFKHNVFLDADTIPCFDLATLYLQFRAGGGMGLLEIYDLLFTPARESVPRGPARAKGAWRAAAYDKSNSGVIFWKKSRATMKVYHAWIHSRASASIDRAIKVDARLTVLYAGTARGPWTTAPTRTSSLKRYSPM